MSYPERRTVVTLVSSLALMAAYSLYAFGRSFPATVDRGDLKFWASTMLIFIGIGVVAMILIQIVFHILMSIGIAVTNKIRDPQSDDGLIEKQISAEFVEDEMHRLIELKSSRVGSAFTGVGFFASLVLLVLGFSPVVMLNVVFFSFFGGSFVEGIAQMVYYRRGVAHG